MTDTAKASDSLYWKLGELFGIVKAMADAEEKAKVRQEEETKAPTGTSPEIIDRKELQKRLNVTEPTVIRYVRRGKIPEIKIGSQCRYNWPDVVESLKEHSYGK